MRSAKRGRACRILALVDAKRCWSDIQRPVCALPDQSRSGAGCQRVWRRCREGKAGRLAAARRRPGVPFLYYGEEVGLQGPKPDERIRTPMPWDADLGAGFTTGVPWQPLADGLEDANVAVQADDPDVAVVALPLAGAAPQRHPGTAVGYHERSSTPGTKPSTRSRARSSDGRVLVVINVSTRNPKQRIRCRGSTALGSSSLVRRGNSAPSYRRNRR